MDETNPPSDAQFIQEALRAIDIGRECCQCANRYHPVWGCLKAAGLFRSLYRQTPFFEARLRGRMKADMHLLIAGTADASSFQMLRTIAGETPVRFTVADRCAAPLRLVSEAAEERQTPVRTTQCDLTELRTGDPWDLVFIHYTLSFMDAGTRALVLRQLARGLAPGGAVICGVKFERPDEDVEAQTEDEWIADVRARLATSFHQHPAIIVELDKMLPAYAKARTRINQSQVPLSVLETEFAAAGLSILERHMEPGGVRSQSGGLPPSTQQRWILVLGRAA